MFTYTYTKNIDAGKLQSEIKAAGLIYVLYIDTYSSNVKINFSQQLTAGQKTILDGVLSSHVAVSASDTVKAKILSAMDFGKELMADYATKRVIRGAGIADTERVLNKLGHIQTSLMAGSLYVALDQLDKLSADDDILQADINDFKTRIQQYLGL